MKQENMMVKPGSDVDKHFTDALENRKTIHVTFDRKPYSVVILKRKVYKRLGMAAFKMRVI